MEVKYTELDVQNEKNAMLEEILRVKLSQIENIRQSTKSIEAYTSGIKSVSSKVKEAWREKKEECDKMLLEKKLSPDAYKYFLDVLESLNKFSTDSEAEAEKILFSKQCEINALAQEFNKLKELHKSGLEKSNEIQVAAVMAKKAAEREYRPDQDPNTPIGRAALDLMARKKAGGEDVAQEAFEGEGESRRKKKRPTEESL